MLSNIRKSIQNYEPKVYGDPKESAVLLPLIKVENEWHILYEVRSKEVSQAGDSSFPGGRLEEGESFKEAAIRETMEELNLTREKIEVIGEIDYIANQQLIIRCFVGILKDVLIEDIQPNIEVDSVYSVPIQYFLEHPPIYFEVAFNPIFEEQFLKKLKNVRKQYDLTNGREKIPHYEIKEHSLWGYTANLTERFIDIIRDNL